MKSGNHLNMNLLERTCQEVTEWLTLNYGKGEYHAKALLREVIKRGCLNVFETGEFVNSPALVKAMASNAHPELPEIEIVNRIEAEGSIKFVTRLHDGCCIESVIIPMKQYNTLCVSTQAGCRMGCIFCRTAASGFRRNLDVHEITGQLFSARFTMGKKIKNIVFMGMGEPLDNMDNVIKAVRVFNDQQGFDVAIRHMTLSTCGLVPGLIRLSREHMPRINLAVSINAAGNSLRSHLMPVNRKYSLEALKAVLLSYPLAGRQVIFIEYILFKGLNDSREDARKLAMYLTGLKVRVNLIGFNPDDSHDDGAELKDAALKSVTDEDIHRFASFLDSHGVCVVKRWGKGTGLKAGCGQLAGGYS